MTSELRRYEQEVEIELLRLLDFWRTQTIDVHHGGFIGRMDAQGRIERAADKGAVLNARLLWSFARAHRHTGEPFARTLAERAHAYFATHFIDRQHGGVYWILDAHGRPLDTEKRTYAVAFAIYGLSEHYAACGDLAALDEARRLFVWLERHAADRRHGGYREAVTCEGAPVAALRLGASDPLVAKSTNTHLHVLEAYAGLYRVWPDSSLYARLAALIALFVERFIADDGHLRLYFDDAFGVQGDVLSYGHDIETAWLLVDAAEALSEPTLIAATQNVAVRMADAIERVLAPDGSLDYQVDRARGQIDRQRSWWVAAETMVGFLHAYQLSGRCTLLDASRAAWTFAQRHHLDRERGEWRPGVSADGEPIAGLDHVGPWKGPYHTMRACIEVAVRCRALSESAAR